MDDIDLPEDLSDQIQVVYIEDEELNFEEMEEIGDEVDDNENIEEETVDLSKLTFTKHCRSVFSSALSSDGMLAVTGGEDEVAYVWSTGNGEVIMECTGHKDSVTEVCFNNDNHYIATGDMGGLIQVWNIKEKKLIWCYEGDDLEWLSWHNLVNVLMAGMHSGDVFIWQIPQGNCKVLASHGISTSCGKVLPDGKKLIIGYTDGQIKLWDIKSATVLWQLSGFEEVTDVDINLEGTLLAVAPKAQLVKISDGKIIGQFLNNEKGDIEAITFNDPLGVIVTGSLTGLLKVFDSSRQVLRHQIDLNCTVTVLKWGPNDKLLVGTTNGAIYIYDIRSGTLMDTLTGHRDDILSISISKDKTFALCTSDDCTAKIFNLKAD